VKKVSLNPDFPDRGPYTLYKSQATRRSGL